MDTVKLSEARQLITALAAHESLLLLSPPGIGKSDIVRSAAAAAGLECRSLLGTQIAPEDVSGVPRIDGERSVFYPPRILLPEDDKPFCLFLDELPAASPDVQKAFYAILLERRIGEYDLPKGSWVVAAGNRATDRSLVRTISAALINRVLVLNVQVDHTEWLEWAATANIRADIRSYISIMPEALNRPVPDAPIPFSTPRAWATLSRALDLIEEAEQLTDDTRRAIACGKISEPDAGLFCTVSEQDYLDLKPAIEYVKAPDLLPENPEKLWFVLTRIRHAVEDRTLTALSPDVIDNFLMSISPEARFGVIVGNVHEWGHLGAQDSLKLALSEATGL